jgi:hypothetical protein
MLQDTILEKETAKAWLRGGRNLDMGEPAHTLNVHPTKKLIMFMKPSLEQQLSAETPDPGQQSIILSWDKHPDSKRNSKQLNFSAHPQ